MNQATIPQPETTRRPTAGRGHAAAAAQPALRPWHETSPITWLLTLCYVVAFFIPERFAFEIGGVELTAQLLVALLLFPVLLFEARIKWSWPDVIAVLVFLQAFYSYQISADLNRSLEGWGRLVLLGFVPYLLGRFIASHKLRMQKFLRWMVWGLAFFSFFLILESFGRINIHCVAWHIPYLPHKEMRLGLTRSHGFTLHAIMLGLVYAMFIPMMLTICREKLTIVGKHPWLLTGCLFMGVFFSLSSGPWIAAFMAVCLVGYDYFFKVKPATRWIALYIGGVGSYYALEMLSQRPLLRVLMMNLHLSDPMAWAYRWELYQRVYGVMPGRWLSGYGLQVPEEFAGFSYSIDNNYLVVLLRYGQIGLALWVVMMLATIVYGWRSVWCSKDAPMFRFARGITLTVPIMGLAQFSVAIFSQANILLWIIIGMSISVAQLCRAELAAARVPKPAAAQPPARRPMPAA